MWIGLRMELTARVLATAGEESTDAVEVPADDGVEFEGLFEITVTSAEDFRHGGERLELAALIDLYGEGDYDGLHLRSAADVDVSVQRRIVQTFSPEGTINVVFSNLVERDQR